jgi:tellurite resistance protein TerC
LRRLDELGLIFNAGVYTWMGPEKGLEFFTGYLIEYSLSVDNIFVFIIILTYFSVSPAHQHRVLFWGILGALIMRGVFIAAGALLLQSFHWIYIFGASRLHGYQDDHQRRDPVHPRIIPLSGARRHADLAPIQSAVFVKRDGK